jgi:hypothetical protein
LHSRERELPVSGHSSVDAEEVAVYLECPVKDDKPRKGHRSDDKGPEEEGKSGESVIPREAAKRLSTAADGRDDNACVN